MYAAGEVTDGILGADRRDSNTLPDTQALGYQAGPSAAEVARSNQLSLLSKQQVKRWEQFVDAQLFADCPSDIHSKVRQLQQSWHYSMWGQSPNKG